MKINQVEQLVGITKNTVADSMKRHLITLEREQQNVKHSIRLCEVLKDREGLLSDLDTHELLAQMDEMERSGASFKDIENRDVRQKRYIGAFAASAVMVILMAGFIILMVWGFKAEPEGAPPMPIVVLIVALPVTVIIGVLVSLIQRIREIKKGEVDDARKF